jgi:hypothetical protein
LTTPCVVSEDEFSYLVGVIKTFTSEVENETETDFKAHLLVRGLFSPSATNRIIKLTNIIPTLEENDTLIGVFPYQECGCLVVYEKREGNAAVSYPKGAIVYNVEKEECLNHFSSFLEPATDISKIQFSSNNKVILDDKEILFTIDSDFKVPNTRNSKRDLKYPCLALKGQCVVGLSKDCTEVVVLRACDGTQNAKISVHGRGSCLSVGYDDRTIVVGCEDGKIMVWTLILHVSDPMVEVISKLPSRAPAPDEVIDASELLAGDIYHITSRTSSKQTVSSQTDSRRPPSHQTVSTAVFLTQQTSLGRETPCHVQ